MPRPGHSWMKRLQNGIQKRIDKWTGRGFQEEVGELERRRNR